MHKYIFTVFSIYTEGYKGFRYGTRNMGIIKYETDDANITLLKGYIKQLKHIHFSVVCNDQQVKELQKMIDKANKLMDVKDLQENG